MKRSSNLTESDRNTPGTPPAHGTEADPDLTGLYECVIRVDAFVCSGGFPWNFVGVCEISGRRYWTFGDTKEEFESATCQANYHATYSARSLSSSSSSQCDTTASPSRQRVANYIWAGSPPDNYSSVSPFIPSRAMNPAVHYIIEPDATRMTNMESMLTCIRLY